MVAHGEDLRWELYAAWRQTPEIFGGASKVQLM